MPPEYTTYQHSAHTNVACEDCHMGRDRLAVLIPRKIAYSWQTGTAMLFGTYTYPIVAKNMAPAREACENCHKPEVFSSDKLVEITNFATDEANTKTSTFLAVKTGGGTERQGLGFGIHWHIENPVYYYATDTEQQNIPYVVVDHPDGTKTEYIDSESNFDPNSIQPGQLVEMDCITCHNRTAHLVQSPSEIMDDLLSRGLVSPTIPGIKQQGLAVLQVNYSSTADALTAISGLSQYYQDQKADFYGQNKGLVDQAVQAIQDAYQRNNFPDQKVDWQTHPNNLGHIESPGCFRCHDGKHLTSTGSPVRLECNLCHSVPVVSTDNQIAANMQLNKGYEPNSHKSPNWIALHNEVFDDTCQGCHTVEDAGGVSNTSFCSNSACHGTTWKFAGFDAPSLRDLIFQQAQAMITPTAIPTPTLTPQKEETGSVTATPTPKAASSAPVTYATLAPIFKNKCGTCHGTNAMKGLNLLSYTTAIKGADDGAVIVPGDPQNSKIIKVQSGTKKHFGQLSPEELDLVTQWIQAGAPEK